MTPRERVMGVLKMPWRPDPDPRAPSGREFLLHEELEGRLEQAIIAAEEAKAKEEREACRQIAVMAARPFDPFSDPRAAIAIQIAEAIAARSAASTNSPTEVKDK